VVGLSGQMEQVTHSALQLAWRQALALAAFYGLHVDPTRIALSSIEQSLRENRDTLGSSSFS